MAEPPKNWLLLAPELFRAPGGIARVSRHYLQALAENRGERNLTVIALNDLDLSDQHLADCGAEGITAIGCDRSKLRCALALSRISFRGPLHVTCTHVALAPLLAMLQRMHSGLTFDIVVHGIEVWRPLRGGQRRALKAARMIFSVSDYTRRDLVGRYPSLNGHTHVLPNALDPHFEPIARSTGEQTQDGPAILAVSRLAAHDWEKGIDHLIEALPRVRETIPAATLTIVGDGADKSRLEKIAAESAAGDAVRFLGRIDDQALRLELARCALFALPSRKEGFGLVYLEAMAAGKPCVVANAGGAPEVIDPASGVVVPYGDVGLLAEALVVALQTTWSIERIQQRAREFSFPAFVHRWRTLCSSVA